MKLDSSAHGHKQFKSWIDKDALDQTLWSGVCEKGVLGKALLPGEQGLRETEVIGPDLAGC